MDEEFRKLKQAFEDHIKANELKLGAIQRELDDKATKQDLLDLE